MSKQTMPTPHNRRYDFWARRRNQFWAALFIAAFSIVAIVGIVYLIRNGTPHKATYNGDALLRVFPKSEKDQNFLQKFDSLNVNAQVWGLPLNPNVPVYVYVKSGSMHRVEKILEGRNITFTVLIEDMQSLIDREEREIEERRSSEEPSEEFDLEVYHPLEEINEWLHNLAKTSRFINVESLGKTYEQRDVLLVTISSQNVHHDHSGHHDDHDSVGEQHQQVEEAKKPIIYINCGIHAREWVAISSCLWMINQFAEANNTDALALLDSFDFWFVPLSNPDGYVYSWTMDRMWRKNRSPNHKCFGVDLNRNFEADFNGTSRNGCSSSFGGEEAESEAETKMTIRLLAENKDRVEAVLFIHSFSQLWLSPFGLNTSLPSDYPEMEKVMSKAVEAIKSSYGTQFVYGSIANVLYAASGTAIDYAYTELGIVHSYVVELRDTGRNGFMLPIEQILPTSEETWDGIKAMALAIKASHPN